MNRTRWPRSPGAPVLNLGSTAAWREAADRMYVPWDERLRIHPQDDSFLDKERWDFSATPEDHYPLLLHYHPLNLYRTQVIKQADTVLAMFLLGDRFTPEQKKRNFDYYDPLTTHDSSLSVCIQSIVANELGYTSKALEYFNFAVTMDLSDVGGNMMHGAHIASIGGSWMALVYGFAGLRDHGGIIAFRPRLPPKWRRLRFALGIRSSRLRVEAGHDVTTYTLSEGDTLTIHHDGESDHPHCCRAGSNTCDAAPGARAEARVRTRAAGHKNDQGFDIVIPVGIRLSCRIACRKQSAEKLARSARRVIRSVEA